MILPPIATHRIRDVALCASIVVAVFIASPLHLPLNNPNEGVRVYTVKALVEQHTFAIDDVQRAWGFIDDKSAYDGHVYSSKAPLMSLFGALAYFVAHPFTGDLSRVTLTRVCRGFGDALPCLALAYVFWRALRRHVKDVVVADVITVGTVLGAGALASMNVFSGHAIALLAPAVALALVTLPPDQDARAMRRRSVVAGLALSIAVGAEYPAFAACAPIAVLAIVRAPQRAAWLIAGALPVVVVVAVAHTAMFGAPWRTGYSFLENHGYQEVVAGTFFGIGAPHFDVLARVLFTPEVGFFFFSPFLIAGVVAFFLPRVRAHFDRSTTIAIAAAIALTLLFIAGFRGWRGGWSVGPRYITELAGLLALPCAIAFDVDEAHPRRRLVARGVLVALVAIALLHSGIAGMFFPHLSDVFANPVHEMMLPVVARGFSPDSIPLWLGSSAPASAAILVVALFAPLLVACAIDWKSAALACASLFAGVLVALLVGPALAHTDVDAKSARAPLEARRMLDNWRPDDGDPYLADPASHSDARTLIAIDRARIAWPSLLRDGCEPKAPATTSTTGPLASVADDLARVHGALIVVPDRFALTLAGVRASTNVFVLDSDVAHFAKLGLPCSGRIYDARTTSDPPPPAAVRNLKTASSFDVDGLHVVEHDR